MYKGVRIMKEKVNVYELEKHDNLPQLIKVDSVFSRRNLLDSPELIYEFLCENFRLDKKTEEFAYLLAMNRKCKVIGLFEIAHGGMTEANLPMPSIFQRVMLCGASDMVVVHNHPSGDVTPSQADRVVYKQIKKLADMIGVNLLDFIIVGATYYSFRKSE